MMGMNATQHAQRGAVLHASSKHRRAYLDANGARIELDVGDNLFQRTGLWLIIIIICFVLFFHVFHLEICICKRYGAEFSTPFGSAMLVCKTEKKLFKSCLIHVIFFVRLALTMQAFCGSLTML